MLFDAWVAHLGAAIYDKVVNSKDLLDRNDQAAADALSVSIDTDKAPYYAKFSGMDNVTHCTKSTMA